MDPKTIADDILKLAKKCIESGGEVSPCVGASAVRQLVDAYCTLMSEARDQERFDLRSPALPTGLESGAGLASG